MLFRIKKLVAELKVLISEYECIPDFLTADTQIGEEIDRSRAARWYRCLQRFLTLKNQIERTIENEEQHIQLSDDAPDQVQTFLNKSEEVIEKMLGPGVRAKDEQEFLDLIQKDKNRILRAAHPTAVKYCDTNSLELELETWGRHALATNAVVHKVPTPLDSFREEDLPKFEKLVSTIHESKFQSRIGQRRGSKGIKRLTNSGVDKWLDKVFPLKMIKPAHPVFHDKNSDYMREQIKAGRVEGIRRAEGRKGYQVTVETAKALGLNP